MKLNRSIEAWDKCDAGAMSQMSEAAIKYAFADAKQDIKRMAAIQAQLVAVLESVFKIQVENYGDGINTHINLMALTTKVQDALFAAGAQP